MAGLAPVSTGGATVTGYRVRAYKMNRQHRVVAAYTTGYLRPSARGLTLSLPKGRYSFRVLAYNERAIRCYRRCGFVEEGRERQAVLVDGSWHDDVVMGILERDVPPPDARS